MGLKTVIIQAVAVVGISAAAGVAHQTIKPISRSLAPASPAPAALAAPAIPAPAAAAATPAPTAPHAPTPAPAPATAAPAPQPAVSNDPHSKHPAGTFVTLEQARQLLETQAAEFIDARNPDEYAAGAIPGAYSIPPDAFAGGAIPEVLNFIAREKKVVVYCGGGSCDASLLVALRLQGMGFRDVVVFKDGYNGWTAAGLPTTAAPAPAPAPAPSAPTTPGGAK